MKYIKLLTPAHWIIIAMLGATLTTSYFGWRGQQRMIGGNIVREEFRKQAEEADSKRADLSLTVEKAEVKAQTKVRTITKTIIEKVNVYVPIDSCPMPYGFRVLHDSAAANVEVPSTTSIVDGSTVPAQDVAGTVIENYGTCHATATRLSGLQAWVHSQGAFK